MTLIFERSFMFAELQKKLRKHTFLTLQHQLGIDDALIFQSLKKSKRIPDKVIYPNFYQWFILMKQFSSNVLERIILSDQKQQTIKNITKKILQFVESYQDKSLDSTQTTIDGDIEMVKIQLQIKTQKNINIENRIKDRLSMTDSRNFSLKKINENQIQVSVQVKAEEIQKLKVQIFRKLQIKNFQVKTIKSLTTINIKSKLN